MSAPSVVVVTGGIGGAKLALGLYRVLPPETLRIIVNTGDDFEHLGLCICPDIDTTLYTLAGLANPELGWGRADESWSFMEALEELGGPAWFRLGDRDLALHVERTRRLAQGEPLGAVIADVAARLGISAAILPASDDPVRTQVGTADGELGFQDYFVRLKCVPAVTSLRFAGVTEARLPDAVRAALTAPDLAAVLIAPSNPYLSIDPILAVPGLRRLIEGTAAPVIAVTPVIAGGAVKGPTAKIMREMGLTVSPLTVARHYRGLIDGFVLDERDGVSAPDYALPLLVTRTLMKTLEDRDRLARAVLDFAASLARAKVER